MSLDVNLNENFCEHCGRSDEVYWANITHNLAEMAREAGIYGILWRPEENGIETAGQIIEPLESAIHAMHKDKPRFKQHNSPNGWGLYENFVPWLERLLEACKKCPNAKYTVSR